MKLATLLYIQNSDGDYLLMERLRQPNIGLMSPPGGKLHTDEAESPAECAVREAYEECKLRTTAGDWKLLGIITEKDFPVIGNIMLFLFRYRKPLNVLPAPCNEGAFYFINEKNFDEYKMPETDRQFIWKNVLAKKDEPFNIKLDCSGYPLIKQVSD